MGILLSLFVTAAHLRRSPKVFFAESTATLTTNRPKEDGSRLETLQSFVQASCPSLYKDFRPAWWLFNGHLQTAYAVFGDFSKIDQVEYDRTFLRTVDGGTIGLDSTPPANQRILDDDTPIVVVLHGLTGGSHESYVRAVLAPVCTPVEQGGLGYRGIVVNFRGCAGVPLTSPQLYSAGHTDDIRVAVWHITQRYPRARLIGLGFSLGANVLTKYLSQEGENCRFIAGCSVANPWDLVNNAVELDQRWFNREVYSRGMGENLRSLIRLHAPIFAKATDHPLCKVLPQVLEAKSLTLLQFDDTVTRLIGGSSPPFPLDSAWHYYSWGSSTNDLSGVRVPFLALNADDDPIVQVQPVRAYDNPNVAFAVTREGGHLGWFEKGEGMFEVRRWVSKPVIEWIAAVGRNLAASDREVKQLHVVDGFLKEVGRDDIGCRETGGVGHVVGVEGEAGLFAGL